MSQYDTINKDLVTSTKRPFVLCIQHRWGFQKAILAIKADSRYSVNTTVFIWSEMKLNCNVQGLNKIHWTLLSIKILSLWKDLLKQLKFTFSCSSKGRKLFFSNRTLQFLLKTSGMVDSLRDILRGSLALNKKKILPHHPDAKNYADPQELKKNIH